jgi:hypothetical protein
MNSVTKKMRLAIATLLLASAPVSLALAEGSNLAVVSNPVEAQTGSNAYPTFSPASAIVSNPVETQTGSNAYPTFSHSATVGVRTGGVVMLAGGQSEPQPINALPSSLTTGDVHLFAQTVNQ